MKDRSEYFKKYREENREHLNAYNKAYKKRKAEELKQLRLENEELKKQLEAKNKTNISQIAGADIFGIKQ